MTTLTTGDIATFIVFGIYLIFIGIGAWNSRDTFFANRGPKCPKCGKRMSPDIDYLGFFCSHCGWNL